MRYRTIIDSASVKIYFYTEDHMSMSWNFDKKFYSSAYVYLIYTVYLPKITDLFLLKLN